MSYTHGDKLTGTCKFWNIEKGYGFVDPSEGGENIFVHNSDLTVAEEKYRALVPDFPVSFTYNGQEDKAKASSVTSQDGTPLPGFASKALAVAAINLAQRRRKNPDLETGKVKFFDPTKGYGFIIPDIEGEDIYVRLSQISGGIPPVQDDPVEYTLQPKNEETGKKAEAIKVINHKPAAAPMPGMGVRPQMGYGMPQAQQQFAPSSGAQGGTVKFFNEDKGFGFIVSKGGGDLHFSKSNLRAGVLVTQGDWVEYQVQTKGDKTWATDVTNKVQQPGASGFALAPQQPAFAYAPQAPMAAYRQPVLPAYAAAPQSGRQTGSVKFFSEEKDFGFIMPSQGGSDIHFSRKNVDGGRALQAGDQVEYDFQNKGGNTWAMNVTMVAPAGQLGKRKAGAPAYAGAMGFVGQPAYEMDKKQMLGDPYGNPYAAQATPAYGTAVPAPAYY